MRMKHKKFLEIPMEKGINLYIELDSNATDDALKALGAKVSSSQLDSEDFMDRYSFDDTNTKVIEGSANLFAKVGESITHIGKAIY